MGGRNINDLTSASDDVLSSDTNKSPQKPTPTSHDRQSAWSKGIENLIKATSQNYNNDRYDSCPWKWREEFFILKLHCGMANYRGDIGMTNILHKVLGINIEIDFWNVELLRWHWYDKYPGKMPWSIFNIKIIFISRIIVTKFSQILDLVGILHTLVKVTNRGQNLHRNEITVKFWMFESIPSIFIFYYCVIRCVIKTCIHCLPNMSLYICVNIHVIPFRWVSCFDMRMTWAVTPVTWNSPVDNKWQVSINVF